MIRALTTFCHFPPQIVEAMGLPFAAPLLAELADGSVVELSCYRAAILWDGQRRDVIALSCDGRPLAGMSLLYRYDLHIEAVDGGLVTIVRRD